MEAKGSCETLRSTYRVTDCRELDVVGGIDLAQ
jgi:hypothetical protein